MHFRASHRNVAFTMLLTTSVTSCNEDYPPDGTTDFAGDGDGDGDDGDGATDTVTGRGGSDGSGAEEPIEPDGVANDAGSR